MNKLYSYAIHSRICGHVHTRIYVYIASMHIHTDIYIVQNVDHLNDTHKMYKNKTQNH